MCDILIRTSPKDRLIARPQGQKAQADVVEGGATLGLIYIPPPSTSCRAFHSLAYGRLRWLVGPPL